MNSQLQDRLTALKDKSKSTSQKTTGALTPNDRAMFEKFKIPTALIKDAGIRRVTDAESRALGLTGVGDMSGIVFPCCNPHTGEMVTLRVRLDNPPLKDGKPEGKYRCPSGPRRLYFPPDAADKLKDPNIPVVLVEAEKSVLALTAWSARVRRSILPAATGGCFGWLQNNAPKESTPLADLDVCNGRNVIVMLDSNVSTNADVRAAREALVAELRKPERKCPSVLAATLPQMPGVNGPDDLIAQDDSDTLMTKVFDDAAPADVLGEYSDDALALRFTEKHGADLRYVALWGQWLAWDGACWRRDETLSVFSKARAICRTVADECGKKQTAQRIRNAQTVAAVERLARSDRQHAATVDQWDADLWLLNTPGGMVDLRTGKLRPATREDCATKITAATPGGDCPLWLKFLRDVTAGDKELQAFLQRVCGYILTGVTFEHALFFLYGTGANGKSVFATVILSILNDYAKIAPIETFTASQHESHPTDLAGLQGARLVTATETEEGRRWAESRLKSATGGEPISARFMRCDFFDYVPRFKLLIFGNHRPGLRSVDEAMRRRMNLIPFSVTIPPAQRDPKLAEKLRGEWGGILAWMVEGCLTWQREGLHAPRAVTSATDSYMAAEDALGRWLDECTIRAANARTGSGELYHAFRRWAEAAGEYIAPQKRFSQNLEARGFRPQKGHADRYFIGLRLLRPDGSAAGAAGQPNMSVESFGKAKFSTSITGTPAAPAAPKKFSRARAARAGGGGGSVQ